MANAIKNPIDKEDLIKFAHRITASYGAVAPDNWMPGDPRRPYPNKEEIRRGYLGHLDDSGKFRNTLYDAIIPTISYIGSNNSVSSNIGTGQNFHRMNSSNGSLDNFYSDNGAMSQTPNVSLPGVNMVSSPGNLRPINNSQTSSNSEVILGQNNNYQQSMNPSGDQYMGSGNPSVSPG